MRYQGGKARIAARLAPVILAEFRRIGAAVYWEPFVGGANMFARVAPHVPVAIGSDAMADVIMMWQAVQRGWLPPEMISREAYEALRRAKPSALRAFAGFGCSFGGKWFGGYGVQRVDAKHPDPHVSYETLRQIRGQVPQLRAAYFAHLDYREARPRPGWFVYCDPPYADTTPYAGLPAWDADEFWKIAESWVDAGVHVLVSEYAAPEGWRCIWEGATRKSLRRDDNFTVAVERLYAADRWAR